MKRIFLLLPLFWASTLIAQEWSANPTQTSLLLFVEGQGANLSAERSGVFRSTDNGLAASFSALFEMPASNRSNLLLKAAFGHRQDDVNPSVYLGRAKLKATTYSFGFGVRFLLGRRP